MIIVNKKLVFAFILWNLLLLIGLGIYGFVLLGGWNTPTSLQAQDYFFALILAFLALLIAAIPLLTQHNRISEQIRKLTQIPDHNSQEAQILLNRMGRLGRDIESLLISQNDLSQLRINRIAALRDLITNIMQRSLGKELVTDVTGHIMEISPSLTEQLDAERSEIVETPIEEWFADLNIQEVILAVESTRTSWKSPKHDIQCTPIFDARDRLVFCHWELDSNASKTTIKTYNKPAKQKKKESWLKKMTERLTHGG